MSAESRGRRITAWLITGLLTVVFVLSAIAKLAAAQPVVELCEKWGLRNHPTLIGIGELVSSLLFAIPRTRSLGCCCWQLTWAARF